MKDFEEAIENAAMMGSLATYSLKTDLNPLFEWSEKEYIPIEFNEEDNEKINVHFPFLYTLYS